MPTLRNTFKRLCAALSFFTLLPMWRITQLDRSQYERVVPLWPLAGWLTGALQALVLFLALSLGLPLRLAVVLALLSRVVLTGALHEDGLADFCDGFGGGRSRDDILRIMKDSHIGTYGVLGLVFYFLVLSEVFVALFSKGFSPLLLPAVDALAKYLSSLIILRLPYVRSQAQAKNGLLYVLPPLSERCFSLLAGILPVSLFLFLCPAMLSPWLLVPLAVDFLVLLGLFHLMRKRIGGYTGDCCGATFLLVELSLYLALLTISTHL